MAQLLSETIRKARKEYEDQAGTWIANSSLDYSIMTFSEKRAVVNAKKRNWKILPGMEYVDQRVIWEGRPDTFRAVRSLLDICIKYDVFKD